MSSGEPNKTFTFVWTIENFMCNREKERYFSPVFNGGMWLTFRREKTDKGHCFDFVLNVPLNYFLSQYEENEIVEISLLASDGSVFVCNKNYTKMEDGIKGYFECKNVIVENLNKYLTGDNLTVVYALKTSEEKIIESLPIFGRTRIGLEQVSFVWPITNFNSLKPFEKSVFDLKKAVKQAQGVTFAFSLDDQGLIIVSTEDMENLKKLKVSILDAKGKIAEFSEYLSQHGCLNTCSFCVLVQFSSETRHKILSNKDLYLPEGVLLLRCEGVFQGEELERYIEDGSSITVRNGLSLAPILTHSESVQLFSDNSNEIINVDSGFKYDSIIRDFRTMFEHKLVSDYNLRAQSQSVPVHKSVLCARSPVFHAMLTSEMKEGLSESMDIPDVDSDTLHRFLLFLYTNEFDDKMNCEDTSKLYSMADKYEVLSLRDRCAFLLKYSLSFINACDILSLSDSHQDEDLKKKVLDYIWRHEFDIMSTHEWQKFESENGPLALETFREMYTRRRNGSRT